MKKDDAKAALQYARKRVLETRGVVAAADDSLFGGLLGARDAAASSLLSAQALIDATLARVDAAHALDATTETYVRRALTAAERSMVAAGEAIKNPSLAEDFKRALADIVRGAAEVVRDVVSGASSAVVLPALQGLWPVLALIAGGLLVYGIGRTYLLAKVLP